ncbi:CIC_collapsed_G0055430.mRNA.1.CDS.1 [Saccharomyces cerevisiae]|nr:CIC_collapsed_G0055430.mRNA.1.CDS.1 [Saccharomyces cerevisiae]
MVLLQHAHDLKDFKKLPMDLSHFENYTSVDKLYWWKYSSCVPTVFHEILNSKACRSAVMFGDELTRQECIILISKLSRCHNPFECAHGKTFYGTHCRIEVKRTLILEQGLSPAF